MDTKAKVLTKDKEEILWQWRVNPSRRYNDYNYIFTYQRNWKSDRIEKREIDNSSIMVG